MINFKNVKGNLSRGSNHHRHIYILFQSAENNTQKLKITIPLTYSCEVINKTKATIFT